MAVATKEHRADVPSLDALMAMYQAGQDFMTSEELPSDADDRDKMAVILQMLQDLMAVEGAEEDRSLRVELRSAQFTDVDASADGSHFTGYAAVFDIPSEIPMQNGNVVMESIERGAFRKSLNSGDNIPMLWNHNTDWPVATTQAGTLKLSEDVKGLRVEANLGNDFISDFLRERVKRGEVQGMSYGFIAGRDNQQVYKRGNQVVRKLSGFQKLLDVSPTYMPAGKETEAEIRNLLGSARADSSQLALQLGYDVTESNSSTGTTLVVARRNWRESITNLI